MICPACQSDNIAGADLCVECNSDLRDLDLPEGSTEIERSLMGDPIVELIPRDPVTIRPETSIRKAIELLVASGRNCALVVNDANQMVGIFTERDVLLRVADQIASLAEKPVSEVMTPNPERLRPTDTIAFGLNRMTVGDYRHVPIERDGQALGVVSVRHVLGYMVRRYPDLLSVPSAV